MKKFLIVLVLVVIVIVSIVWYIDNRKLVNENLSDTSPLKYSIMGDYSNRPFLREDPRFFYDQTNPDVLTAKNVILKDSKISEKYFNEHFKFISGVNEPYIHKVDFLFSIGEYSMITGVSLPNKNGDFTYSEFGNFHEISKVMSKEEAGRALIKCLGNNPFKYQQAILSIRNGGLFMYVSDTKWDASLNLETGECEKTKFVPFID